MPKARVFIRNQQQMCYKWRTAKRSPIKIKMKPENTYYSKLCQRGYVKKLKKNEIGNKNTRNGDKLSLLTDVVICLENKRASLKVIITDNIIVLSSRIWNTYNTFLLTEHVMEK